MLLLSRGYLIICLFGFAVFSPAQNEYSQWYFGFYAGLNFLNSPPTPLTNGSLSSGEQCASYSDKSGNLLFYTDGKTVYNKNHAIMVNGTGLLGPWPVRQGCMIVPQPGSNSIYFIFTLTDASGFSGFYYSVVDMSLNGGLGAVSNKNVLIYPSKVEEKMTGTYHCNGRDVWVLVHEAYNSNFHAYLVSSAGVNTTPVISNVPPTNTERSLTMKLSPDGSKLASVNRFGLSLKFTVSLYDFDNSTGIVSNHQPIVEVLNSGWGVEFSADGSKLYAGDFSSSISEHLHQWDLCAGSMNAIIASHYSVASPPVAALQLAGDGKIYLARGGVDTIGIIHNPNLSGIACNFVSSGLSLGSGTCASGLPNFISRYQKLLVPFTSSLVTNAGCHAVTFTANLPYVSCASTNFSVNGVSWDLGDPATGPLNLSSSLTPTHVYSSSGSFTASLILHYKCGSDTIRQVVYVPPPIVNVSWTSYCNNLASGTVSAVGGVGPYNIQWMPGSQTGSIVSNLSSGNHTISMYDQGLSCTVSTVITITAKNSPTITLPSDAVIPICAGTQTSVSFYSNATSHSWTPSQALSLVGTSLTLNPISSQVYSITGELDSCTTTVTLSVEVFPLPYPTVTVNTFSPCLNGTLIMQSMGTENAVWSGPSGFTSNEKKIVIPIQKNTAGEYSLSITDSNGCKSQTVVPFSIIDPPTGTLGGLKQSGCAPLCTEYKYEPANSKLELTSTWHLNNLNFENQFTYCLSQPGDYIINGVIRDKQTTCTHSVSYPIKVYEKPHADFLFSPKTPTDNQEAIKFECSTPGIEPDRCSWFFYGGNTLLSEKITGDVAYITFPDVGPYVAALIVMNEWGCSDTVVKPIIVTEEFAFYVPNAFTPNNDLLNDVFFPVIRGARSYHLSIYNRWGKLLFETSDIGAGWDGTYKGEEVQQDIYVWKIQTGGYNTETKTYTGHVSLIRQ